MKKNNHYIAKRRTIRREKNEVKRNRPTRVRNEKYYFNN